jgi:Mrp family chromosome partitioning ATPase
MKTQMRSSPPTPADRLKEVAHYTEVKRMADHFLLLQRQKQFRSLAVLSLFPGEGKTLFTALLATAYTQACHGRVLAVDTTTLHTPRSLRLHQCLDPDYPLIDFVSLDEYRHTTNGDGIYHDRHADDVAVHQAAMNGPVATLVKKDSDQYVLRKLAEERSSQYDMILLDTAPLASKNKGNIDPLVMARIADASVLVMNPHRLDKTNLAIPLNMLKDPALHLIGIVSNEEFAL